MAAAIDSHFEMFKWSYLLTRSCKMLVTPNSESKANILNDPSPKQCTMVMFSTLQINSMRFQTRLPCSDLKQHIYLTLSLNRFKTINMSYHGMLQTKFIKPELQLKRLNVSVAFPPFQFKFYCT